MRAPRTGRLAALPLRRRLTASVWLVATTGAVTAATQTLLDDRTQRGLMLACGLLLIALTSHLTVRIMIVTVADPLIALSDAARAVRRGDYTHRLLIGGNGDELTEVTRAFNQMAARLEVDSQNLVEKARRDELTGLFNRREFNSQLAGEVDRSRRYQRNLSLLLVDIDHFKKVNDTYGHQAGDVALQQVAARLKESVRPSDVVARYGGEEMAILLPETSAEQALVVAERVRESVAHTPVEADGTSIPVAVSIGIGTAPEHAKDGEALTHAADMALYNAKENGRNRVVLFQPGMGD